MTGSWRVIGWEMNNVPPPPSQNVPAQMMQEGAHGAPQNANAGVDQGVYYAPPAAAHAAGGQTQTLIIIPRPSNFPTHQREENLMPWSSAYPAPWNQYPMSTVPYGSVVNSSFGTVISQGGAAYPPQFPGVPPGQATYFVPCLMPVNANGEQQGGIVMAPGAQPFPIPNSSMSMKPEKKRRRADDGKDSVERKQSYIKKLARAREKQGDKWQKEAAQHIAESSQGKAPHVLHKANQVVAFRGFLERMQRKGIVTLEPLAEGPEHEDKTNPLGIKMWIVHDTQQWWTEIKAWFEDDPERFSERALFMMLRRFGYKPFNKAPAPATSGKHREEEEGGSERLGGHNE
ncbi:hypothetical protein GUITHDRAFT_140324 [Guillardia theta CCMP2712]|uniref:Uncharacterized protein n=1 Tax=Guillardia theta (strain CCMP2712) TaxID=905079 RepID=L1J636_GUITC|nr:hypothetical protein GUITHDRAFT_140324 [Guillardia theta CCMP2712]EKX43555.1 hypothetical protein GUITHDRAFT_140324 [Guillardia theta CCMP2712]|eukprot:XP_005830535.1 hypothetical protein GUITHDRAFT_140324 [Guillardia theta CCMP2712]